MKSKITTLSLLLLFFISTLFYDKLIFSIVMALISTIALRELLYIRTKEKRLPIEVEILSYVVVIFFTLNNYNGNSSFYLVDYKLLASLILLDLIPLVLINNKKKYNILDALYLMGATLFIGITFNLITQFRTYNINYVTYIFLIAFINDLFAFITGMLIGKNKLLPTICPKKTIEGAFGGLFMGTIISTMFFISTIESDLPVYAIFMISLFLSFLGQIGDYVFSFIKKEFNKKEFSNLFNQNGGILDIIDSIIFITLGFVLIETII